MRSTPPWRNCSEKNGDRGKIGAYKKENRLPIHDPEREKEVLKKNLARLNRPEYADLYADFMRYLFVLTKRLEEK